MTTREQFLNKIRNALGRTAPPETVPPFSWRRRIQKDVMKDSDQDELARVFVAYSKTVGADVIETTRDELNESVLKVVKHYGAGPAVMQKHPLLEELCTADALGKEVDVHVWYTGDSREESVRFAEKASVGIAVAEMALAETATVLLFSHKNCGRSVTLLPESVIYIIPKSSIHPRLTQAMELLRQYKGNLPSSVNFVSGPSTTSDIELVRVVGVHGPVHATHIVVDDT